MKSSLIDLTLAKHHETKLAILVSETGDASKAVWLPLSVVEIEETKKYATGETRTGQKTTFPLVVVTMPERMAIAKGLV